MRFDIVIGNPPYQKSDGSGLNGGSALYDKFIQCGEMISSTQCMVVPMRWISQPSVKGIDKQWVYRELHCNKYRILRYEEDSERVFDAVRIRGGVMYFVRQGSYNGKCLVSGIKSVELREQYLAPLKELDIFIANSIEISILLKTESGITFDSIVGPTNEFGLESNAVTTGNGLTLYRSFGETSSCSLDELRCTDKALEKLNNYKVIMPKAFGYGLKGEIITEPKVLKPKEVCTGSFIMIGNYSDEETCLRVVKYMKTKLFNLLLGMRKSTHNGTREVYKFIPMQDFSDYSDIDWSTETSGLDEQLYKKYELTQDEVSYIELLFSNY